MGRGGRLGFPGARARWTMASEPVRGRSRLRVAADVGGTFTDVVTFDEASGEPSFGKTLTTPANLVDGIVSAVGLAGRRVGDADLFLHGTTVAINTILERSGARTALVTTEGFRDIYEIGRINRPDAYNLFFRKHEPLIARSMRFELRERVSARGEVLVPLEEASLEALAAELAARSVEAVAILFLHSYANPAHELQARRTLERLLPGVFVSASHELSQEYREFERTSTVAANAYIGPRVRSYLSRMQERFSSESFAGDFFLVQSSGGLFDVARAKDDCIRMLESGPAAGVIGARAVCSRLGLRDAIAFDMGGTTAKAGVIAKGEVVMAGGILIGGYSAGLPIQIPLIDIQEVGTGGGSIARVEEGGGLRVGPQSSGADPGPACYGRGGTEPTVTDANLVLGRLSATRFLGGEMPLDVGLARHALRTKVADALGIDLVHAAEGIVRVAATTMSHVVPRVTTERGLDAGDFTMIAYGGAGPLHASLVARELRIPQVVIPPAPGHFSAFGMLMADLRRDLVRTWFSALDSVDLDRLEAIYAGMERDGCDAIRGSVPPGGSIDVRRAADMRYVGQEHAVAVDLDIELFRRRDLQGIKRRFDATHEHRYGFCSAHAPAEIVSLHVSAVGQLSKPELVARPGATDPPRPASRPVYFGRDAGFVDTPVVQRSSLPRGWTAPGPLLVEEHASTTVVLPGDRLEVGAFGDLILTIGRDR